MIFTRFPPAGHHHSGEERQGQQDLGDAAAGSAGIRRGGHLRPVSPGHGLRAAEGDQWDGSTLHPEILHRAAHFSPSLRVELMHLWPLPGHPVQEAGGSGDGGGAEESGHARHHRQQQHDPSPLPTGTVLTPLTGRLIRPLKSSVTSNALRSGRST